MAKSTYPETSVDIVNKNLVPKSNILINKRFPTRTSSKIYKSQCKCFF